MAFVTLSKEQFEEILPPEKSEVINDISREYIYEIPTSVKNLMVRIYSTVDKSTNQTRDRGEDAIRIVFWDAKNDRPIGKGKKILRIETSTTIKERIQKRIDIFLKDAPNQVMIDWDYVKAILTSRHIKSNFALDMYAQLETRGCLSDKQLAYILGETNPKGYQTFEAKVKQADPFFYHSYMNEFSDEENEIEEERIAIQEESSEVVAETPNLPEVFSVPSDIHLIPTYEYDDWSYPFDHFNPVQSAVMPHRKKDCNMVIGANTSAGKTICAELIMDYVLKVLKKRVVYLSPLKALTQEKYSDWQKRFPDEDIAILTGDYVLSKEMQEKLNNSRIIALTSEMLDSYPFETKVFCHKNGNVWRDTIGNIVQKDIDCEVFSYHPNIGIKPTAITNKITIGPRPIYKVTLQGNRSIRMTESHNLFIKGKDNQPIEVKLKDIDVGDYVAISKGFITPSTKSTIPILDILLSLDKEQLETIYIHGPIINQLLSLNGKELSAICRLGCKTEGEPIGTQRRINHWRKLKCLPLARIKDAIINGRVNKSQIDYISMYHSNATLPATLSVSNELAMSLAMFVADGNTNSFCANISQKDDIELLNIARIAFDGNIVDDNKHQCKILQINKLWNMVLSAFGNLAKNKHLPDFVFSWRAEQIESFLAGLLRFDRFYTSSQKLASDIRDLRLMIGKTSSIQIIQRDNCNPMYEVRGSINAEYRKSASHNHYHDHIRYAKIISIEPDGVEDVYDLEVQPADCPYKVENWVGGEGGLLLHNSRSRKFHAEKNYWLQQVGMIIVDESHILCMDRGHPVEAGIMRFAQLNSEARIIFLSATMPNVGELGEWLTNLNGKHTEVIFSTWRPVHLQMHYEEYDPVMYSSYGSLRENYNATQQVKLDRVLEIVMSKPEEKFLIFVHAKGMGRQIIYELKKRYNETALFHNADLDLADRREVENSFRQRVGGLRVMVSTSTLAWGINLPARNVVIAGIHRGLQEVDELDIIQMAGRAGRFGVDDQGHVYLVIPRYSTPHWIDVFANPRPVTSVIKNHEILAFHALAEVATKNVKNSVSFLDWYKRSLAYQQKFELSQLDSDALFDDLKRMEMLNRKSESPRDDSQITGLGLVSAWMYYSPYDIDRWHKNFNLLIRGYEREDGLTMRPEFDDLTLAWALADIPSNDIGYVPKPISDECADLQWKLRNRNIQCGTTIHCVLAAYKCLKGDDVNGGEINVYIRSIRYDIRRVCQALRMIDHMYARWQRFKTWDTIADRIIYGIPEELCELVRIPGIGAKRAKALWDEGIKSIEDVADDKNKKKLFSVLKVDLGAKVRKEAKRIIEAA